MGPERTDPKRYADTFRTALRLALAEGSRTDSLEVARSRASLLTWRVAGGLGDFRTGEEIRSRVYREEAEARGVEPLSCGPFTPDRRTAERARGADQSARDRLDVPRAHGVEGERPRRSGSRH